MFNKLYLIGNGFDIHHGLRTSYVNFRDDYIKKKYLMLWNDLLDIYGDAPQIDDLWWKDFENMLGRVDYESLSKSHNGEAMGFMKVRNLMKGKLPPLFKEWIKGIDSHIDRCKMELMDIIDADSLFFTFNYTMLLEKAYQVKEENVWHIHGSVKHSDDIFVGHDTDAGQLVNYTQEYNKDQLRISPTYSDTINQETLKGAKKVRKRIHLLEDIFFQYCNIKHFIVMGFSFNDIDMPYIEKIIRVNKNIADTRWTIFWHSFGEDCTMMNKLIKSGIKKEMIKPEKW